MAVSTVNISFQEDLLNQIDKIAKNESRTRSELIREAARIYIERKKSGKAFFHMGKVYPQNINLRKKMLMMKYRNSVILLI
jgi:metal-responsive CopG/Arc/MetJ family transcriptional regulator